MKVGGDSMYINDNINLPIRERVIQYDKVTQANKQLRDHLAAASNELEVLHQTKGPGKRAEIAHSDAFNFSSFV